MQEDEAAKWEVQQADAFEQALAYARNLGEEHGKNAASWWEQDAIGGRTTGDPAPTARRVLQGLEDGDPEILDALPTPDLSGEWADTLTGPQLIADALDAAGIAYCGDYDENAICDAYDMAFSTAAEDAIAAMCRNAIDNN